MTRWMLFMALVAAPMVATAADDETPAATGEALPEASEDAYRIGSRDVVQVVVYGESDLSGRHTVREDGTVFVPLIEEVELAGLTPQQAARRLSTLFEADYLVNPQVQVEIVQHRSRKVTVTGAVKNTGEYYLDGPTSLLEMLARAGNIDAEKSAREVRIQRADGREAVVGLDALLSNGEGDLPLRAGDQVIVPEGQFVYVAGEVAQPGAVVFWEGLTVTQALTKVGGPSDTARLRGAYLLRDGERVSVNLKRILDGREADMTLKPGDQLFLKESPL